MLRPSWPLLCVVLVVAFFAKSLDAAGASDMTSPSHDKVVVCYVATWAVYRKNKGSFALEDLDPSLCTHLVYAFAGLDASTSTIKSLDPWQDLKDDYGKGGYERATALKRKYPHLKVTLAIGGWNEGSEKYSQLAASPDKRKIFVNSAVAFLKKYNFDGLDLDWEYPAKRGGLPEDKQNFVLLAKELKEEFQKHNYLLTAAFGASKITIDSSYDVAQLSKYLDFIHMMCYDYHGTWDGVVGPNAPLYGYSEDDTLSSAYSIDYMISLGAPPEKLVMGLPLYGRTFVRNGPTADSAPVLDTTKVLPAGFQGPYTREDGFMGYNEICEEVLSESSNWTYVWDDKSHTPYAYSGDKFVTFDDQRSIALKLRFAMNKKLKGVMVWSIDTDDFGGNCLTSAKIYDDFEEKLKSLQHDSYFKKIVNDLKLPAATDEDYNGGRLSTSNWYVVVNGVVRLNIPTRLHSNYPLMRTIDESIVLAQQEQNLLDTFENKVKEIITDNEVPNAGHRLMHLFNLALFAFPIIAVVWR